MEVPIEPGGLYLSHRRRSTRSKSTFSRIKVRVMGWFRKTPKLDDDSTVNVPKIVVTSYETGEIGNTGRNTEMLPDEKTDPLDGSKMEKNGRTVKSGATVTSGTVSQDVCQSVIKKSNGAVANNKTGGPGVTKKISFKSNNNVNSDNKRTEEEAMTENAAKINTDQQVDHLSKAREEVIAEVRAKIAKDRGKGVPKSESNESNSEPTERSKSPIPPPIPPTKALAVAKIKQKIMEARQEEQQKIAQEKQQKQQDPKPPEKESDQKQNKTESEKPEPKASDLICSPQPPPSLQISPPTPKPTADPATRAETMSKIKQAILAAALDKANEGKCDHSSLSIPAGDERNRRRSFPSSLSPTNTHECHNGQNPSQEPSRRRRSSSPVVPGQEKKRSPLIWNFFEQGKSRGVCRTCGYAVGVKHNTGGLVRHLSLVHPREYRCYTTKMDENWTHGMMEKNLNMRVPKRF